MFPLPFKFPPRHALSVPKRKGQVAVATLSSGFQELSQHRETVAKDTWKYGLEGGCVGNPGFKVLAELGMLHQYSPRSFRPPTRLDLCKRTPLHEHGSDLHRRVQRRPLEKGTSLDMPTRDTTHPAISLGLNPKRGGSLYIRLRELSKPRLCTRWNHTPSLQRGLSRIRVLSPPGPHFLKLSSGHFLQAPYRSPTPQLGTAGRLSVKRRGKWCFASVWVRYVCNVNSNICLVFPTVFC